MRRLTSFILAATLAAAAPALPAFAQGSPGVATPEPAARAGRSRSAQPKKEPTIGQMAARERQRKCGVEWKDAKASGKTAGQKWPQFWSQCNARLKGNSA